MDTVIVNFVSNFDKSIIQYSSPNGLIQRFLVWKDKSLQKQFLLESTKAPRSKRLRKQNEKQKTRFSGKPIPVLLGEEDKTHTVKH